jgi:hypothetical protein
VAKYRAVFDNSQAAVLREMAVALGGYGRGIEAVAKGIDARDGAMAALKRQLLTSAGEAGPLADRLAQEGAAFEKALDIYVKAERGTYVGMSAWPAAVAGVAPAVAAPGSNLPAGSWSLKGEREWEPDDFKNFYGSDKEDDFAEKIGGVYIGYGEETEWALAERGWSGEYGAVSAKLGAAEAHWEIGAGMYRYEADGSRFWSPTVEAEIGASVAVLALAAEGAYTAYGGDTQERWDDFGAQGEVSLNVGAVAARGEISSALFDKDGQLNPQFKAGVSAEAVAAEAEASAGITVAGVEANVTGSLGVGAGVHADIGYTDGKFNFEVGAYAGIGGSVGFDVDVGAAVDAVRAGAKAVSDWVGSWSWW